MLTSIDLNVLKIIMQLTLAQRVFEVERYWENNRSIDAVKRLFAIEYPNRDPWPT